jgi:hypothetical protein
MTVRVKENSNVTMEVSMNTSSIHFFNNSVELKHVIVNIPPILLFGVWTIIYMDLFMTYYYLLVFIGWKTENEFYFN